MYPKSTKLKLKLKPKPKPKTNKQKPPKKNMEKTRCEWCTNDPIYKNYHDNEWGKPNHNDNHLFEMLILEGAQAGLSWLTILKKRENYRKAFDNFNPKKIANYDQKKIEKLLQNSGIIRNKLKIHSAIKNAKIFLQIQKEHGNFYNYLKTFTNGKITKNTYDNWKQAPTTNELSDKISKNLKKKGMTFVGSTIIYSYLEAIGIMNNHTKNCFMNKKIYKNYKS